MTPTQQPSPTPPEAVLIADIVWMLRTIYHNQQGWVEIGYIDGDPRYKDMSFMLGCRWHRYSHGRARALARFILELAARYGNVYVSRTCYSEKKRSKQFALPSRAIVIDDAPEDEYSFTVRTSSKRMHAWVLLDCEVEWPIIEEFSRRGAYASRANQHGDKSGWDCTQMVRVPGTFNTKAHGSYPVALQSRSDRVYTVAQLRARWPDVPDKSAAHRKQAGEVERPSSDVQWPVGGVAKLLTVDGIPRRWKNRDVPGWRVLRGELRPERADGSGEDTSEMRYLVISSLVMHGYPDDEIVALASHLCDYDASARKGLTWLERDIARCITRARTAFPAATVSPSTVLQARTVSVGSAPGRKSRARKDRPTKLTADQLYAWLGDNIDSGRKILKTQGELAVLHTVSLPTIARLEKQLRDQGRIRRITIRTAGNLTYVELLGAAAAEGAINIAPSVLSAEEGTINISDATSDNVVERFRGAINMEVPDLDLTEGAINIVPSDLSVAEGTINTRNTISQKATVTLRTVCNSSDGFSNPVATASDGALNIQNLASDVSPEPDAGSINMPEIASKRAASGVLSEHLFHSFVVPQNASRMHMEKHTPLLAALVLSGLVATIPRRLPPFSVVAVLPRGRAMFADRSVPDATPDLPGAGGCVTSDAVPNRALCAPAKQSGSDWERDDAEPPAPGEAGGWRTPIDLQFVCARLSAGDAVSLQAIRVHCALHHLDGIWPAPFHDVIARARTMLGDDLE
jgi:hypothetical protein